MVLNVSFTTGMRRMFYLVSPEESSFEKAEDVPKYITESYPFFIFFVVIEVLISMYKQDKKVRLNDSLTSVSAGMYSRLPMLIIPSISIVTYVWIYKNFNIINLPWNSPWTWWLCFLGVDLGYYWFHRLAHEVNFMWAAHQVHHSSEDYNFSTALRQSVLQIYTSWVFYLPLALCIPPPIFIAHNELNILYQFWIHTQYIRSLGPLEYILNTPSHHRVHHGRNRYCIDKNYAGTLIIWDRIFGTFTPEEEEVAYGLTHPVGTFDATDVQFGYGEYLVHRTNKMISLEDKVKSLLYGPGWLPGKARTGDINDIPQIEKPIKRYGNIIPTWLNIYVVVHFSLVFIGFQILPQKITGFNQATVILFLLFIGFSLTSFGRLFDGRYETYHYLITTIYDCL
ncbi:hypothetical protein LOTGIDRAFT_210842 [Lottia gigantea]|uniref:Alkylglycerol monooxygenase n=1 Tax=Lottia gigantea TaxID=225164 RepID=V3Z4L8_LOTGI|nr:hypothetical protein LOTGIDRAFT_210842 [Lottia gigantea]ESO85633.1 hypothetical protein LOTGIDRAFT_210842 [Lottia gigantea]